MSFTDTCPGNSYCVSQITMETGEAQIPYTMTAYSKENDYTCTEEGILVIKNSWKLKSTVTSSKSKRKLQGHWSQMDEFQTNNFTLLGLIKIIDF